MSKYVALCVLVSFVGCSSSRMVDQWISPDISSFEINKVLVIGMTSDEDSRRLFESKLTTQLEKEGVKAVESVDFFERSFTTSAQSVEELDAIENILIQTGFDAVLFSKVTGSESKMTLINSMQNISNNIDDFRSYFYENQNIYYDKQSLESYQIYHTETLLYCLCPEKDRELLWKGSIDIIDPRKVKKSVSDYVKTLLKELKSQQILFFSK